MNEELKSAIKKLQKDPDYNLDNTKVETMKENDLYYFVRFKMVEKTTGPQLLYTIDKKTYLYDMVFLPSIDGFDKLEMFEKANIIYQDSKLD